MTEIQSLGLRIILSEFPYIDTEDIMLSRTVTLTDAQIKSMPSVIAEIIPAPGVSKAILPISAVLIGNFAGGAYTNINTSSAEILLCIGEDEAEPLNHFNNHTGLAGGLSTNYVTTFLTSTSSQPFAILRQHNSTPLLSPAVTPSSAYEQALVYTDLVSWENKALGIFALNSSDGDFTGGNAANTLRVTVYYVVVDL